MSDFSIDAVRDFFVENFLFGDSTGFDDETSFRDESILDSTGILELIAFLETTYGIRISNDELTPENLDTLNLIDDFMQRKLAQASA